VVWIAGFAAAMGVADGPIIITRKIRKVADDFGGRFFSPTNITRPGARAPKSTAGSADAAIVTEMLNINRAFLEQLVIDLERELQTISA
jgi:hypothetical protein